MSKTETMLKAGLKLLRNWMMKKPMQQHQEKQKQEAESMIRMKHLVDLQIGSKKKYNNGGIYK